MEEKIGRETLQKLLELQIHLLDQYTEALESDERKEAKEAVNDILKAVIAAVGPIFLFQRLAYNKTVGLHEEAVTKTSELLSHLLEEERKRAQIRDRMRNQAERGRGKK